jgi:hypothetical protein
LAVAVVAAVVAAVGVDPHARPRLRLALRLDRRQLQTVIRVAELSSKRASQQLLVLQAVLQVVCWLFNQALVRAALPQRQHFASGAFCHDRLAHF